MAERRQPFRWCGLDFVVKGDTILKLYWCHPDGQEVFIEELERITQAASAAYKYAQQKKKERRGV
jgi:hypothetical protein